MLNNRDFNIVRNNGDYDYNRSALVYQLYLFNIWPVTLTWLNEAPSSGVFVPARHVVCIAVRQTAALPAAAGNTTKKGKSEKLCRIQAEQSLLYEWRPKTAAS